ncbi:MAG: leucyl aminopeptidase family protein [Xanthomonadales bacterium]|nr:leucyl aminopeptidase family protein [Gammaproteobacteria bacterium]MBT8052500.1 leucyl aminopeptidase family protein [Gammaproteobacteria bacterium]NND57126.1 leucyl aminopeptidase family protein [Xanthomonadales bacterium]NNK52776.1 leucyl aminopeptidase family protein [Xanthomonadales bacterium]
MTELQQDQAVIPLRPLAAADFDQWKEQAAPAQVQWAEGSGFKASPGQSCAFPAADGKPEFWLFGVEEQVALYRLAALAASLPEAVYRLDSTWSRQDRAQASLGWGLGSYCFDRYKANNKSRPLLLLDEDIDSEVRSLHHAQCLVRDLVNTPTEHMGPSQLASAVQRQADAFGGETDFVVGADLLTRNFPAIHAVGRASDQQPRLLEMTWGDEDAPVLSLVGKGVCFDTGGLDLKSAAGMKLMKKDMGGAAHALALARLVMEHRLPVRLKLLIPAVENAVSGNAYRPGDIIPTRKGLSVEIGNTDAEGRVVLSDALAYACEDQPDLVIDFATLTGAARIALGADLPPLFSNHDDVARAIQQAGDEVEDPLWTLPLYQPYRKLIESPIADINNSGSSAFGGCITAALFLESFVETQIPWVHIDTFAWNQADRPGRPQGGEALGLRAVFKYLQSRYR